jgi:hypothetical protein
MWNLREDYNWGKLVIIQSRTFYLAAIKKCKDYNTNKTIIFPIALYSCETWSGTKERTWIESA